MDHPEEQPAGTETSPKFGRLLLLLAAAVMLLAIIAMGAEAYFS